jgi:hypothetical protein
MNWLHIRAFLAFFLLSAKALNLLAAFVDEEESKPLNTTKVYAAQHKKTKWFNGPLIYKIFPVDDEKHAVGLDYANFKKGFTKAKFLNQKELLSLFVRDKNFAEFNTVFAEDGVLFGDVDHKKLLEFSTNPFFIGKLFISNSSTMTLCDSSEKLNSKYLERAQSFAADFFPSLNIKIFHNKTLFRPVQNNT